MSPDLIAFITNYGYLAVFFLVMIQELGIPNPVPTEFIILFAGYLTSINVLDLRLTFLAAVLGDLLGTTILCLIFYIFGKTILEKKPHWIFISLKRVNSAKAMIKQRGKWIVFVWRLVPYIRGYASIAAGFLNMPLKDFIPMAALSALLASGGYVLLGHWLGSRWQIVVEKIGNPAYIGIAVVVIVFLVWLTRWFMRRRAQV